MAERSPRIFWVDVAKALAIVLVVFGHAWLGVRDAGLAPDKGPLSDANYVIYTFHMAAFFFISGLFLAPRAAKGATAVLSKMPLGLLWPYVVWACLLLAMQLAANDYINGALQGGPGLFLSIWRSPPSPYWYIYVLVFFQLIALTALRLRAAPLLAVLGLAAFVAGDVFRSRLDPTLYLGLHFFLFFALGVQIGRKTQAIAPARWFDNAIVAASLFAATVVCATFANRLGWSYYDFRLLPVALAGGAGLMILARIPAVSRNSWLAYIGERSLAIYVMHVFFTAGVRIAMANVFDVAEPTMIVLLATTAGVAGPLVVFEIVDRLRLARALGLGPGLRKAPVKGAAVASPH